MSYEEMEDESPEERRERERAKEVRRIRRMLKGMIEVAEGASLTGALSDGAGMAVEHYNRILQLSLIHI